MKPFIKHLFLVIAFTSVITTFGQEKAEIMKYPTDWRYERINFPLDFAKDISWEGFEELRFSPGMFDIKSSDYFTYYFVLSIKNKVELSQKEIQEALVKYYRGLCKAVNPKGKFDINYDEITVTIDKLSSCSLKANVVFFDGFTDGRRIELEMLLEVRKNESDDIILLASVAPTGNTKKLETLHQNNLEHNLSNR
ncbi:conserved hypothetical protein [Tenacibaculum sp. 190524A05c]|uniref:hypothetical protein n=1 Tax=Tenacibaculum platacis TaxID=3137852 RepID=UPI0031FAE447